MIVEVYSNDIHMFFTDPIHIKKKKVINSEIAEIVVEIRDKNNQLHSFSRESIEVKIYGDLYKE